MSDLPQGWEKAALDDLVAAKGDIVDGPFGSNLKTEHYRDSGPRVVRLQNIGDGHFVDEHAHISEQHFESLRKHEVIAGDVLVASLGETLPRVCVAPESLGRAIVKADCIRIRPADGIHPAYVAAVLNSPIVRAAVAAEIQGVGRPRINLSTVRNVQIPVPPIKEQARIVDELERRLSHVEAAEAGLRSSLRRLLVAREAVLWSLVLPGSDKPAGEDGLVALPPGWDWRTLGAVADVAGGVTKDSKRQVDPTFVEVPYLRVANVQRGRLELDEVTTIRVHPDKAKALYLQGGDILFNEGGDRDKLGRGWVWEGQIADCIHQNHVFRARLTEPRLEPKFVSYVGNTFGRKWFEAAGKQTTNLASINMRTLKAFPVPVPPAGVASKIVAEAERRLSLIDATERAVEANLKKAAQLRRSLLFAAYGGRLVPQDSADETAGVLLERIRTQRAASASVTKSRKPRAKKSKEQAA
jgi:type I restriction enzyme S subunit